MKVQSAPEARRESAPEARRAVRRVLENWLEAVRKIGFFLLLVAGSAAFGFVIAWPLWLFATTSREAYTISTLCLVVAGCAALAARAYMRSRRATRDPGKPRRAIPSAILAVLIAIVALAGGYLLAALVFRGLWILAMPALLAWAGLLWLLGFVRHAVKGQKGRPVPAENKGE